MILDNRSPSQSVNNILDSENLDSNDPNPKAFSLSSIKVATNDFSSANKLGEGGFGPVYKVIPGLFLFFIWKGKHLKKNVGYVGFREANVNWFK